MSCTKKVSFLQPVEVDEKKIQFLVQLNKYLSLLILSELWAMNRILGKLGSNGRVVRADAYSTSAEVRLRLVPVRTHL